MDNHERPLFSGLQAELGSLGADIRTMAKLRWELARRELTADAAAAGRLAVILAIAALLALVSLPLLVVALGCLLDGVLGISQGGWLCIFSLCFLLTAALGSLFAWRRFRRNLVGLEETIEEFREDMLWLREWSETKTR